MTPYQEYIRNLIVATGNHVTVEQIDRIIQINDHYRSIGIESFLPVLLKLIRLDYLPMSDLERIQIRDFPTP